MHLYNIVHNKNYNIWTDPQTNKRTCCNRTGWNFSLEQAVMELDPNWITQQKPKTK
jgi:hypothetical protein